MPDEPNYSLTQLKRVREWRRLTQEQLAESAGVKVSSIQKQERGVQEDAKISLAAPLAKALGVPIEALFLPEITNKCVKVSEVHV